MTQTVMVVDVVFNQHYQIYQLLLSVTHQFQLVEQVIDLELVMQVITTAMISMQKATSSFTSCFISLKYLGLYGWPDLEKGKSGWNKIKEKG